MTKQYVVFDLLEQKYAINIELVNEITNLTEINSIPGSHPVIEGVVNLRGKVIPLINLAKVFGQNKELNTSSQVIIVNMDNEQIGLIIDQAKDVKTYKLDCIQPINSMMESNNSYIVGTINVNDELIQLISVSNIIEKSKYHIV